MASEMDEHKASLRENVLFYVTAFFCLVAIFSLFIFLFLVPFFIEPALATIYMEFDPQPVMCQTVEATFHRGLSNCQWSSCREGCTKEVYECWHIRVQYFSSVPPGDADARSVRDRMIQYKSSLTNSPLNEPSKKVKNSLYTQNQKGQSYSIFTDGTSSASSVNNEDRIQSVLPEEDDMNEKEETYTLVDQGGKLHSHEARLQPNVKGCGYPPDVVCNNTFASTYGVLGANFSCYYSLINSGLAITHLNIEKVRAELIYCLTIPIILFVISVVYLFYAYFKLYAEPPTSGSTLPKGTSAHSSANFGSKQLGLSARGSQVEGVVVSQPLSSPLHVGGKYGLLYQFPSPDTTRIVRRAKSGGAITLAAATPNAAAAAASGIPTKDTANLFTGSKNPSEAVNNRGMRMSKSMGPRLGECSMAGAQRYPDSLTHISSTISSAPSSPSSSTSSLSSRSDSSSSSLSHLPATLSDSSDNTNANSVASISAQVFANDKALEYYSPSRKATKESYASNSTSGSPSKGVQSEHQRRKLRECIPLISNKH